MVISDLIDLPSGVDKTGKLNPVLLGAFPARGPQYTHNTVILLFIDLFVCVRVPVYMCYDFKLTYLNQSISGHLKSPPTNGSV